ncbi:hypothetical protein LSTR_LSTR002384 [Laodelphax striatellus]|uniref:tRNA (guanine(26)-N(2))-dimethyltransferase n=1 Tax=Laodelphax striatellus TaxID=195883 RepID=A0A482X3Z2_LAOST|nr:hypothetical protein LSTR_LSTR002384 [Laodelphax striatellus]
MTQTVLKNKSFDEVEEAGVKLRVSLSVNSPRKTELFYDKNLSLARLLVTSVLHEYVKSGDSVLKPVKCLEAIGNIGAAGLLWKKFVDGIHVTVNATNTTSLEVIRQNANDNGITVDKITNKDPCALMYNEDFNFVYLDCHTSASHYFDAVFRNLPRDGIVAITTKDDPSLQTLNPDGALRNYHGLIGRTSYINELGVRLVIAAMARSASKYRKGIEVLLCGFFKNTFLIIVKAIKGSQHADSSLRKICRLAHCSMCEERAFYPPTNDFGDPKTLLSCDCSTKHNSNLAVVLGPVWTSEIFKVPLLKIMIKNETFRSQKAVIDFLLTLLEESMSIEASTSKPVEEKSNLEDKFSKTSDEPPTKIKKVKSASDNGVLCGENGPLIRSEDEIEDNVTPPFYYNIIRLSVHSSLNLKNMKKIVLALRNAGYKASRTHFCKESVRTNANKEQITQVIENC